MGLRRFTACVGEAGMEFRRVNGQRHLAALREIARRVADHAHQSGECSQALPGRQRNSTELGPSSFSFWFSRLLFQGCFWLEAVYCFRVALELTYQMTNLASLTHSIPNSAD